MQYSVALKNNVLLWRRSPRHRTLDLMNRTISIKYIITYFECIYYFVNDREKTNAEENKCNNIGNILKDNSFESGLINLVCHGIASAEGRWNLIFLFFTFLWSTSISAYWKYVLVFYYSCSFRFFTNYRF